MSENGHEFHVPDGLSEQDEVFRRMLQSKRKQIEASQDLIKEAVAEARKHAPQHQGPQPVGPQDCPSTMAEGMRVMIELGSKGNAAAAFVRIQRLDGFTVEMEARTPPVVEGMEINLPMEVQMMFVHLSKAIHGVFIGKPPGTEPEPLPYPEPTMPA